MVRRAALLWVLGLCTAVPFATYHLLFHAPREQYPALIVFVLFWIFGYWGLAGPLIAAVKVRRVFRAIERAQSKEELLATLSSAQARDMFIDLIATENHLPRFLATWVYQLLLKGLARQPSAPQGAEGATRARLP